MFEVRMLNYENLTTEQQEEQPDNGSGKESATYIRVMNEGKVIALKSDAMQPEDCVFYRDLNWITELLRDCYEMGRVSKQE